MYITKISITKSRTSGVSAEARMKFNKIIITMDAELYEDDDYVVCYDKLSTSIDEALEKELAKKLKDPIATTLVN